MKSKDLQIVVLHKHESDDHPRKIFRDLNSALSLDTIQRWVKIIEQIGSINLLKPLGRQRTPRTKASIRKVKQQLARGKRVSKRKLARELNISDTSVHQVLRYD
jgi:predicted AAA+ superfamily ATPase